MQGIISLRVCNGRVGIVRYEQVYDVKVSVSCGPLERGRLKITPNGVDVGALLSQISTGGKLGINRSPMKGCAAQQCQHRHRAPRKRNEHILVISVIHGRISRLDELLDSRKIASLCSGDDLLLETA